MTNLDKLFKQATMKALVGWETDMSAEEVIQELWVWYLERPKVQKNLNELHWGEAVLYVRSHVHKILTGEAKARDLFEGRSPYSSENVKDALKGRSNNRYLIDILPLAMAALDEKNAGYAEALRSRYEDGIIPKGAASDELLHAHKSITEHVNIIAITAGVTKDADGNVVVADGPGSAAAIFPDTRKSKGADHSDPTADVAIALLEKGDEPLVLCARTADGRPIPDGEGDYLDSDRFTTYRKEFVA
ncbi:putative transcription factor [Mycobacterium phage ArcherNM]|uniref:sigma-K factor n=1 Tax=Mycobacterium phage ArcherNM TaxID=1815972 RepID=UPI00078DDE19|nr:sigma-K factor [Mycobacterium phage ArcherNM]AMS01043.1 putative transcription factor [Mycobacterium phage ArcherNM]